MKFVLDASAGLSWLLDDAEAGQAYAADIFSELAEADGEAYVPATWALEIADVLAKCEARQVLQVIAARHSSRLWRRRPSSLTVRQKTLSDDSYLARASG